MVPRLHVERRRSGEHKFTMRKSNGNVVAMLTVRDGTLLNFMVQPAYRKKGLGKQLFRAALNHPVMPERLRLTARPHQDDKPIPLSKLEAFYSSFGFRAIARTPISVIMENRPLDRR